MSYSRSYTVEATITKLAGLEQILFKVEAVKSCIIKIKSKNGMNQKNTSNGGNTDDTSTPHGCDKYKSCDNQHLSTCNKLKDVPFSASRYLNCKPKWTKAEKQDANQVITNKVSCASTVLDLMVDNGGENSKIWLLCTKGLNIGE